MKKTAGSTALSTLQSAAKSSAMYQKAIEVYGHPDDTSAGDSAKWSGANGSAATYSLDGDALEIMAQ